MTDTAFSAAGCPSGLAPPSGSDVTDPAPFVRRVGGQNRLSLSVRGAKCGGCMSKSGGALAKLPGVDSARLNLSSGQLDISWNGDLAARRISETVSALGYGVAPLDTRSEEH